MKEQVLQLRYAFKGAPWVRVTNGTINANYMQYSLNGAPWWGHRGGSTTVIIQGNVKRILKVDWPYVKTVINVEG